MPPDGSAENEESELSTLMSTMSSTWSSMSDPSVVTSESVDSTSSTSDSTTTGAVNVEQKLFLVMSVALATVCFFTNAIQICVFIKDGTVRSVKSLLLLSQAISGLCAVWVVAFPIEVISARGGVGVTEEGFDLCYLGHSGVILLTMLTSLSTATLLLLDYHLHKHHHEKYVTSGSSLLGWGMAVAVVWIWAAVVAILPWMGWNTWLAHDARCHLSTLWPLSFTAFVTFLVALHIALALLMWASGRAASLHAKHMHQRLQSQGNKPNEEDAPQSAAPSPGGGSNEGAIRVAGWLVSLSSVVPVLGHVVMASSCAASTRCMMSARHYHEEKASLPWPSLLLTTAAVTIPLLYVFSDDHVSASTLQLLTRICCCGKRNVRGRPGAPRNGPLASDNARASATAVFHGGEGGVVTTSTTGECGGDIGGSYVTNSDTQLLVGDAH